MTISRMQEPRQLYGLGSLVKKITKPIKKIVKSPIGKAALTGAALYGLGGAKFLGGKGIFAGGQGLARFSNLLKPFQATGKLSTLGDIFRVGGKAGEAFSVPRMLAGGLGAAAVAAPFLMGGDEEEVEEESFTGPISSVESIRDQARQYYGDPTNSALYFMPPKSAVRSSFYAADGGLASIPRDGYRMGNVVKKAGEMIKAGMGKVKSLFDDADINVSIRDEDVMTDAGLQAQAVGQDVFITPKSNKDVQVMEELIDEGYEVPHIIHPNSYLSSSAKVGLGTIVFAGSVIQSEVKIGKGVIINTGSLIDHDTNISDGVHICPGVTIAGNVSIDSGTWVGIGSTIIQNINIGKDTADKLFKLLEVLEDNDDVQVVSSNFEVDDNVLSSLTA